MSKPIIAIDLDDVLAHSTDSFRREVNELTGAQLAPRHYKVPGPYWHYYEHVLKEHDIEIHKLLPELDAKMVMDQSHVPPYTGAKRALRKLSKEFRLVLMTARNPGWEQATHAWLHTHYPGIFSEIIFAGSKHADKPETKGQACKRINAAYLIDDNVEHCSGARDEGIIPILFGDYGWHVEVPDTIVTCRTWAQVINYFGL